MHRVQIRPVSVLAGILGQSDMETNTMHHQCVKTPGEGLSVVAYTSDRIPEAMENEDGSVILVQWHPEELLDT